METNLPKSYFLKGSKILFTDKHMLVTTILGSCVSIILYSNRIKFTAISHALLPKARSENGSYNSREARFVDSSILRMVGLFDENNIGSKYLNAKLYGGADSLSLQDQYQMKRVGKENINTAKRYLNKFGIKIVHEDVGENFSRKITYDTSTNKVRLKKIQYKESVHDQKDRVQFINN